jgi:hypothetical protein
MDLDHVIAGKFNLGRKIGRGSSAEIYIGLFHVSYFSFEILIVIFLFVVTISFSFFLSAVNEQTEEVVAVKLVC